MGIFKKGTVKVLTPETVSFPSRLVSFTCFPGKASATLQPIGDREVPPIHATGEGHLTFLIPEGIPGWGATLEVTAEGYEPFKGWIIIPLTDWELPNVFLEKTVAPLPKLRTNGTLLSTEVGPFTWIGCTDFALFKKFLDKEDISDVLKQRAELGFNGLRVLSMCANMFRLNPADYPSYYEDLADFVNECAKFGLYTELCVFADAPQVMPSQANQLEHWRRICEVLKDDGRVLLELGNELNHPSGVNRIDPQVFPKPAGIISSHGSNISGDTPVRPDWDYETFHWNDLSEWQRKCAHNPMEDGSDKTGKPAISDENTRFPDKDSNPNHAYDAAAGAALLCAGATFHSVGGKRSSVWEGLELLCAKAWADGARSVPLWAQTGFYRRYDNPNYLRIYSRTVPGRGEHIVNIRF